VNGCKFPTTLGVYIRASYGDRGDCALLYMRERFRGV